MVISGVALGFDEVLNEEFFAQKNIKKLRETFKTNTPFPHLVFEGLVSPKLLELMHSDFDNLKWNDWTHYDNTNERKLVSNPNTRFGHATQLYFNTIHSGLFVDFLEQITGVEGLITDPELHNGGLHEMPRGGKFALHMDFNQHSVTRLDNRLVFITYLNRDWLPSYGGALELWSVDEDKCKVEIQPAFGRSILLDQSTRSLHGLLKPIAAPDERARRSAAAYFYSNGRLASESASFHTTIFTKPIKLTQREAIKSFIKYVIPPVMIDAARKLKTILG